MRWLLALVLLSTTTQAQQVCTFEKNLGDKLASKYQEEKRVEALAGDGILEIYVSQKGTFTMIVTYPSGLSCVKGIGTDWSDVEPPPRGDKT